MLHLSKRWSTHLPILIKVVRETKGPILEIGSGIFSTPILHWLCSESGRKLVTYENEPEYYKFAKQFKSRNHKVNLVESWDEVKTDKHWSVVLIDHEPQFRRSIDAIRFKNNADFIVLHDTEERNERHYNYHNVWPHFKYRFDYTLASPQTTVVSNFKDLSKL